jgi:hypothetical protein
MATCAQVQGGVIVNVIVTDDTMPADLLNQGWGTGAGMDCAPVQIDNMTPMPGIGWTTTDDVNFTAPA